MLEALKLYWKPLAILAMVVSAFFFGVKWEGYYRDSKLLKERDAAIASYQAETVRTAKLSKELEELRRKRQGSTDVARNDLAKDVGRSDVYARDCVTDDGLRILNDVLSPGSGERHGTMPTTVTPERKDR